MNQCPYVVSTRLGGTEAFCIRGRDHVGGHVASSLLALYLTPSPTWHLPDHSTIGTAGVTNQDDSGGVPVADDHERHAGHASEADDIDMMPYAGDDDGPWSAYEDAE